MEQDDLLVFADEESGKYDDEKSADFWNILIVDDEPNMHQVTKMVLRDLVFHDKKVKFFDTFSAQQTKALLETTGNIALAIIDVVMEEDDAGLKLVEYIRDKINNKNIRIILRTGQPGFAPEKEVIINYDINDYKEKVELSAQKLITSVISALRNYEYIDQISTMNNELEAKVAARTTDLKEANKKLTLMLQAIQDDQEAGRIMQNKLLPLQNKKIQNYHFCSKFYPSLYLSGDFFDYFEIDDNHIGFYIADVSGHGISSAIVTVLLKNFIDSELEKFHSSDDKTALQPDAICKKFNNELLREKLDKYLTIFYGVINTKENKMYYINSGQFPYPFIIDTDKLENSAAGDSVENTTNETGIIEGKGTPVGLFKIPIFRQKEMLLPNHFKLIMFSDGVLEILPQELIDARTKYLYSIINDKNIDSEKIIKNLGIEEITSFPDDLTFLIIEKNV